MFGLHVFDSVHKEHFLHYRVEKWEVGGREVLSVPTEQQDENCCSPSLKPELNELNWDADIEGLLWNEASTEVTDYAQCHHVPSHMPFWSRR